jgi:16S rRNA C1402 (ribose-2'-O) methylase RsmI
MDIKKLCQLLGLPETATEEQIIAKLTELKAGAAGTGGLPEAMSKEFASMKDTVKAQAATITRLEHTERVAKYLKDTALFTAVAGKPEEIAESLASLEEKSGEASAKQVLTTYQNANKAGEAATLILGTSKKGEKAIAFEDKVQQYAKANPNTSRADAIKATMRAEPDLYRESREQGAE